MNAALFLVLVLGAQEADPLKRILERLAGDDFAARDAASRELLDLPAARIPALAETARAARDPELAARLRAVLLPEPWPALVSGTIGEALSLRGRILGEKNVESDNAIAAVVAGLSATAVPHLERLLSAPEPGARKLALAGLERFPPARGAPLLPLLDDPAVSYRAGLVIAATGDRSVVPDCLERFRRRGPSAAGAGAVLKRMIPDDLAPMAEVYHRGPPLSLVALEILRAGGSRSEETVARMLATAGPQSHALLQLAIDVATERSFPAIRDYLARTADAQADRILAHLRDPVWAAEALARRRAEPGAFLDQELARIAPAGGVRLRAALLDWLAAPGVKVGERQALLPVLGVAGLREDGALAVAALEDPRLREAAGEALDRLGDPEHARPLVRAWMKGDAQASVSAAVAGLDAKSVEAELLEILADPRGYPGQSHLAVVLAGRSLTPRLREALLRGLAEGGQDFAVLRGEALRALAGRTTPEDLPWIRKLKASEGREASLRVAGHLLALRGGDASSALPLARILPDRDYWISLDPSFGGAGGPPLLRLAEPSGDVWTEAVVQVLREKPAWVDGARWLAELGRREGFDALRAREAGFTQGEHEGALLSRAWGGEEASIEKLYDRALQKNYVADHEMNILIVKGGPALWERVWRRARERSGIPRDPAVLLTARRGGPEAAVIWRAMLDRDATAWGGGSTGDPLLMDCMAAAAGAGDRGAIPRLRPHLRALESAHRAAAALALARLGDRESIPLLLRLVDDPEPVARDPAPVRPRRRVWHAAMEALEMLEGVRPDAASTVDRRAWWRNRP